MRYLSVARYIVVADLNKNCVNDKCVNIYMRQKNN